MTAAVTKVTAVEILKVEAPSPPASRVSISGDAPTTASRSVARTDWEYKT